MKNHLIIIAAGLVLGACASKEVVKSPAPVMPKTLEEAVASPLRTEKFRARDQFRHPVETLKFFDIQPQMTVLEIWPSGGWYTEIVAPYLNTEGKYIIADPPADPRGYTVPRMAWMEKNPTIKAKTQLTQFHPETHVTIVEPNTVDRIITFRSIHNWGELKNQEAAFKSFFAALKPGGILGVVEHRAPSKGKVDPKSGYIKESSVIKMAEKAGFKLEAKSEINANPKDKANHPHGVWSLPPSLRAGEQDKEKYLEIGESDRMTLKFIKPN